MRVADAAGARELGCAQQRRLAVVGVAVVHIGMATQQELHHLRVALLRGLHQRRVAHIETVALHIVGTKALRKKCLDLAQATALHGIEERDLRLRGRRVASGFGLGWVRRHVEHES
ncbi:hypothetical protein D3C86_1558860 [compost metagenome]